MNKYANTYLSGLMDALKKTPSVIPSYIALGGLLGGARGSLTDPGVDEEGNPKSRLSHMLKNIAGGGAVGGVTGAGLAIAAPPILEKLIPYLRTRAISKMPESGLQPSEWLNSPKKWMSQLSDTLHGGPGSVSVRNIPTDEMLENLKNLTR